MFARRRVINWGERGEGEEEARWRGVWERGPAGVETWERGEGVRRRERAEDKSPAAQAVWRGVKGRYVR